MMNRLLKLGIILAVAISNTTYAATDLACQSDCMNHGMAYPTCTKLCSDHNGERSNDVNSAIVNSAIARGIQMPHLMTPMEAQQQALQVRQLQLQNQLLEEQLRRQQQGQ